MNALNTYFLPNDEYPKNFAYMQKRCSKRQHTLLQWTNHITHVNFLLDAWEFVQFRQWAYLYQVSRHNESSLRMFLEPVTNRNHTIFEGTFWRWFFVYYCMFDIVRIVSANSNSLITCLRKQFSRLGRLRQKMCEYFFIVNAK